MSIVTLNDRAVRSVTAIGLRVLKSSNASLSKDDCGLGISLAVVIVPSPNSS